MSNHSANETPNPLGENTPNNLIKPDPCNRAWVEVDSKAIENNSTNCRKIIEDRAQRILGKKWHKKVKIRNYAKIRFL